MSPKTFKIQRVLNFHGYLAKHPSQTGCRLKGVWFWVRGDQKREQLYASCDQRVLRCCPLSCYQCWNMRTCVLRVHLTSLTLILVITVSGQEGVSRDDTGGISCTAPGRWLRRWCWPEHPRPIFHYVLLCDRFFWGCFFFWYYYHHYARKMRYCGAWPCRVAQRFRGG